MVRPRYMRPRYMQQTPIYADPDIWLADYDFSLQ